MRFTKLRVEQSLFIFIFIIALSLRLLNLGATPLTDGEASLALRALDVSSGERIPLGPQPAYVLLTGALFWIFGATNFVARIVPALSICFLIFGLYFLRNALGRKATLITVLALAVDPGFVAISRMADGPALSIFALGMGLWALYARKPVWLGLFSALMLVSGPYYFHGLIILVGLWGISVLLSRRNVLPAIVLPGRDSGDQPGAGNFYMKALLTAGTTLLVGGTLFFLFPLGVGSWVGGLTAYIQGWIVPSGTPSLMLLASLPIYQPLGVIFGILGSIQAWRGKAGGNTSTLRPTGLGLGIAICLVMLYPGRQMSDLGWVILPLYIVAAMTISDYLTFSPQHKLLNFTQALAFVLLCATLWLQLSSLYQSPPGARINLGQLIVQTPEAALYIQRISLFLAIFSLMVLVNIMVVLGRSWEVARAGLVWGLVVVLGGFTLASTWRTSQLRMNNEYLSTYEMWDPLPSPGQVDLLEKTLGDLSLWQTGDRAAIQITTGIESPSLRWVLRAFRGASSPEDGQATDINTATGSGDLPLIVITSQNQEIPSLAASYRGQDFVWKLHPGWSGVFPDDFAKWLVFRRVSWNKESVILWARTDLFPGGALDTSSQTDFLDEDSGEQIPPIE
ncbi:MAG: hypothetical protein PHS96_01230 [Anaerolineales bacterium]|nr:hypothetical protein [Anaerolineales bacterium]